MESLKVAVPYETGTPRSTIHGFFGVLYPIYVRGEAFLALHQPTDAAAEFHKILDHRGLVWSDPVAALARLQLARALSLSTDKAKLRPPNKTSSNLWKECRSRTYGIPAAGESRERQAVDARLGEDLSGSIPGPKLSQVFPLGP